MQRGTGALFSAQYVDDDEVPLNTTMVHAARFAHFRGFWPALCRRRLMGLLDKPLEFVRGSTPVPSTSVSEQFRSILDRHWTRFGADVIDEIMTVGVVATRRVRINTGDEIPTVISSEGLGVTHMITVRFDTTKNQNVYRVYRSRAQKSGDDNTFKLDRKAVVLADFGSEPMLNGEIRSTAWAAVFWETYFQSMLKFSYEAEFLLMRPAIVAQQPETGATGSTTEQYARYGEGVNMDPSDRRMMYARQGGSIDRALFERQVNAPAPGWTPPNQELLVAQTQHFRNVLTLPPGATVGKQHLPDRNTALPELARMYESAISALYGVPRAQLIQDTSGSSSAKANSEMSNTGLRHTVLMFSSLLAKAYTWAYNDIYGDDELEISLRRVARAAKGTRGMTEAEIFSKAIEGARVRVVLSLPPTVTEGNLFFLWQQKIITWEEYHDSLRTLGGFTARMAPAAPPDEAYFPPEEEKPAPAGGGKAVAAPTRKRKQRTESLAADYIMHGKADK